MAQSFLFHYGMKIIPFINSIKETTKTIYNNFLFYYTSIQKSINSDTLYFFDKNPTAYIGSFIDVHNSNNGVIVWKYSRTMKKFFQYSCQYKDTKHFPIISASIQLNGENKFILDDFLSDLLIERTNADFPNLQQVVEVWTYNEGIVLDRTQEYRFVYMDHNLNEHSTNLFTGSFNFSM